MSTATTPPTAPPQPAALPVNLPHYRAWIKSTPMQFYEIDYSWKKGSRPKRGKFSPDIFINLGSLMLVVEIKDEGELREPSEENRKKNEYAQAHFDRVNSHLEEEGNPLRYKFNFLTESEFNKFFQALRGGTIQHFRSELDVKLFRCENVCRSQATPAHVLRSVPSMSLCLRGSGGSTSPAR